MKTFTSKRAEDTIGLGREIGRALTGGTVVALVGDLASGKTVFTKGIAEGLGLKDARYVNSPTFLIMKEYEGRVPLYHFDVYRLTGAHGLGTVGYADYFFGRGVCVIEWADKIEELLPQDYLRVEFKVTGDSERRIRVKAHGKGYKRLLEKLGDCPRRGLSP